jgi:hypothetical protein
VVDCSVLQPLQLRHSQRQVDFSALHNLQLQNQAGSLVAPWALQLQLRAAYSAVRHQQHLPRHLAVSSAARQQHQNPGVSSVPPQQLHSQQQAVSLEVQQHPRNQPQVVSLAQSPQLHPQVVSSANLNQPPNSQPHHLPSSVP